MVVESCNRKVRVALPESVLCRSAFSILVALFMVTECAMAERGRTYPGVILSTRGTAEKEASLQAAAASFQFFGLSSESLSRGSVYLCTPSLSADDDKPKSNRRNLGRTARVRKIIQQAKGHVTCSENFEVSITKTPNDPMYESYLWGLKMMAAPAAWDITTGTRDAIIAVVDTGIYQSHPDLANNIWVNPGEIPNNNRDDDYNGYIDDAYGMNAITRTGNGVDDNGHGTHVAGTIGATGDNLQGVVGLNWNIRLMAAKFLSSSGSGSTADAIKAIEYVISAKKKGHNVIAMNNSWGGGAYSKPLLDAILNAGSAGILFVAAAGNSSKSNDIYPSYPASYRAENIISVASIDSTGGLSSFSNYGVESVHIAAPGSAIVSTVPTNRYASYSGTSMACPHVTGLAGLAYAACPGVGALQLKGFILNNGVLSSKLSKLVSTGSVANAAGAVLAASANCSNTPTRTPTASPITDPGSTPTAVPTATPTPTPTITPLPTQGYLFAEPSTVPVSTKTTLSISNGKRVLSVISLRFELADSKGTRYSCGGRSVVVLPTGSRKIDLLLPVEAKYFPTITVSFDTLTTTFTTRITQTGTENTLLPYTRAAQACQKLSSKVYL